MEDNKLAYLCIQTVLIQLRTSDQFMLKSVLAWLLTGRDFGTITDTSKCLD